MRAETLMPLQGVGLYATTTQGIALGYVLLAFQAGVAEHAKVE